MDDHRDARPGVRLRRVGAREARGLLSAGLAVRLPAARGWPTGDTLSLLGCVAGGGRAWFVVDRAGRVVGECAAKAPPDAAGVVEIGYALAPSARGHGLGRAVIAALVARLDHQPGVLAIEADVAADNVASRRVLERAGFAVVRTDENSLRYRRPTTVPSRPRRW